MTSWPGGITAITLFVADVARSKEFYSKAFSLPVHYEDDVSCVFQFGPTLVNLLQSTEVAELVEPASMGSGATSVHTLTVDDVDATVATLTQAGVALLNGPVDRPWGIRTATFADPDGHLWEIAR
jgi:catechol 2,3-dioxygenase-like lactoylglutathione lyase family enzyme